VQARRELPRKLVWIESQHFLGFGCSQCNWVFKPSGVLVGESLDKMKMDYEAQREKTFAARICAEHPKSTVPKTA
jgi:hypothetical protein